MSLWTWGNGRYSRLARPSRAGGCDEIGFVVGGGAGGCGGIDHRPGESEGFNRASDWALGREDEGSRRGGAVGVARVAWAGWQIVGDAGQHQRERTRDRGGCGEFCRFQTALRRSE